MDVLLVGLGGLFFAICISALSNWLDRSEVQRRVDQVMMCKSCGKGVSHAQTGYCAVCIVTGEADHPAPRIRRKAALPAPDLTPTEDLAEEFASLLSAAIETAGGGGWRGAFQGKKR